MVDRCYWDSDCFLGWLQEEPDKVGKCDDILGLAERGQVEIVTSALTLAEVLMLRPRDALPETRRARVEGLFAKSFIHTMPVTRRVGESARDLVWDHGIRPKDAIHVVSALAAKVRVLNTFDAGLISKSRSIGTPPLIIEQPTVIEPGLGI